MIRQGDPHDGLGEEMYAAHKAGKEMPDAVEYDDDDPPALKEMKNMITAMTSFYPDKRLTSTDVYHQTRDLYVRNAANQVQVYLLKIAHFFLAEFLFDTFVEQ